MNLIFGRNYFLCYILDLTYFLRQILIGDITMEQLFIGIDSGTQGTKVIVLSKKEHKIISEGYAAHPLIEQANGKREQEPSWWIDACSKAIEDALSKKDIDPKDVCAIGVSGQQHGMVAMDKEGKPIRAAKLWCDTETTAQAERLTESLGGQDRVNQLIGNSIAVGFTASKILWLKENEPEKYERLDKILLPHDYINYWLTGEKKAEYGDASGTAYFDIRQRKWSKEVLNAIDNSGKLENCLPELIHANEPVGKIRDEIKDKFHFNPDLLISSGGGDNMMAAIGTGNVASGIVTASLGTSGTIYCFSDKPVIDSHGELAAFCSSDGNWLPLVCTMNVTVSTELTRNVLAMDIHKLNEQVAKAPVGSDGLILLPYFNGERTPPLPNAKATLYGLTSTNYQAHNLCRAAMEGATFGLKYGLEVLERNGITAKEIRLVGGGAKSSIWRQIVSDIFDCSLVCPITQEAGALGAALQALWCYLSQNGEKASLKEITDEFVLLDPKTQVEPDQKNAKAYKEIYRDYLKLNQLLKPMY
jgi:xylulokinase